MVSFHKLIMQTVGLLEQTSGANVAKEMEEDALAISGPSQNEDYFPSIAIQALMRILKDPSLSAHHTAVVQAVMYIFKTLGLKCVPFLPQVCA